MSDSFSDTIKLVAAYGRNLSMLSYDMYFSKNTNFVDSESVGSIITVSYTHLTLPTKRSV